MSAFDPKRTSGACLAQARIRYPALSETTFIEVPDGSYGASPCPALEGIRERTNLAVAEQPSNLRDR